MSVTLACTSPIRLLFQLLTATAQLNQGDDETIKSIFTGQITKYFANGFADYRPFVFFSATHYCRNLVFADEFVEVILICWGPGHESRVHNHGTSECFMVCIEGEVEERRYVRKSIVDAESSAGSSDNNINNNRDDGKAHLPDGSDHLDKLELELISSTKLGRIPSHINDSIALHSVANASIDQNAITLHVYSPPIQRVEVYEWASGGEGVVNFSVRSPGFYSVGGRRTGKE